MVLEGPDGVHNAGMTDNTLSEPTSRNVGLKDGSAGAVELVRCEAKALKVNWVSKKVNVWIAT